MSDYSAGLPVPLLGGRAQERPSTAIDDRSSSTDRGGRRATLARGVSATFSIPGRVADQVRRAHGDDVAQTARPQTAGSGSMLGGIPRPYLASSALH